MFTELFYKGYKIIMYQSGACIVPEYYNSIRFDNLQACKRYIDYILK